MRNSEILILLNVILILFCAECTVGARRYPDDPPDSKVFLKPVESSVKKKIRRIKNNYLERTNFHNQSISNYIHDLAVHEFVFDEKTKRMSKKSSIARREIIKMGSQAVLALIEGMAYKNTKVRVTSLSLLWFFAKDNNRESEFLPVIVRSLSDSNWGIRETALAIVGEICRKYAKRGEFVICNECLGYIRKTLNEDPYKQNRAMAALLLYRFGMTNEVPEEFREEIRLALKYNPWTLSIPDNHPKTNSVSKTMSGL